MIPDECPTQTLIKGHHSLTRLVTKMEPNYLSLESVGYGTSVASETIGPKVRILSSSIIIGHLLLATYYAINGYRDICDESSRIKSINF